MGRGRDPTVEMRERKAARHARSVIHAHLDAFAGAGSGGTALADDVVLTIMETGEITHGRPAVAALLTYLHCTAFAAPPAITNLVVEAERAMVEAEFAGAHLAEFAGISPAGREVHISYTAAYDLRGNTIAFVRLYLSLDEIVRQLRQS
jgi:predicted ester cyclase